MLLCSVKIKKHTVTLISLICAAVFIFVCIFALSLSPKDTIDIGDQTLSLRAESEEDAEAFLSSAGYEANTLISQREVVIPSRWSDFYASYAETQKQQGFDLSKQKGKDAKEYTYSLKEDDRYAVILICDGRICAAHLSRMDGSKKTEALISSEA